MDGGGRCSGVGEEHCEDAHGYNYVGEYGDMDLVPGTGDGDCR